MAKPSPRPELLKVVRSVRNRWRLRRLMYALALLLAAGVVLLLLTALLLDYFRFAPGPTRLLQFGAYAVFLVLALSLLLRPLWRRVSDRRIALYLEEHEPSLQAALLSAVEHGQSLSPFGERQLEQALVACRQVDNGRRVERQQLYRGAGWLTAAVSLAALVAVWNPAFLRHALPFLTAPISGANASNPYQLSVSPGDVEVEYGADQLISVALQGFSDPEVRLFSRVADGLPPEGAAWRTAPMAPGGEDGGFELFLFDLRQPLEYYVEADGLRSPSYRVEVIEYPVVQSIALTLRYPAYTGKTPQHIPDGGDIVALVGTEVELRVTPSRAAAAGELVLDNGRRLALEPRPHGSLVGNLVVKVDGGYRVELSAPREGGASELRPASPQYVIDALDDRAPTVTLTKPGRDSKVTRIEEPFFELRAEDDLGIGALELVLTVNGEQRPPLRLYSAEEPGDTQLTAGHTLFLEELDLHPGDLISYFARVRDSGGDQARQTETDIYFLEVRPFQRIFRAAEQQGGGGGGQQGENDIGLASQQRELVVATFKAIRDRDSFTPRAITENLNLLARAQARIRDRVEAVDRRLRSRDILQLDEAYQQMATELPKAVALMHEVEAELQKLKPERALPHAQGALRHLQRAEAAFLEAQVAQNSQSGGGTASAEDLEELFQLELDKLRNQYETVQRGQQQASQAQAERDELLQKLKQLAQRQQRENERAARRQAQQNGGSGSSSRQQALAEQAEELLRQLEKLTRQRQTPELQTLQRQLADAAASMRRAAAGSPSEQASAGQDALERLRQARQSLQRNRSSELRQQLADARSRGERLAEQQRRLAEQVRSLRPSQDGGRQGAQPNGQQQSGRQSAQQAGAGQQSGRQSGQQAGAGQQSGRQSGQQAGAGQQSGQPTSGDQAGGGQRQQTVSRQDDERQMPGAENGLEDSAEDAVAAELQRRLRAELRAGKQDLTDEVRDIEQRLRELAREARAEQPAAARRLQLAADDLRNRRVDAKIRQSQTAIDNDALDYARALEAQIETDLARLNRGLEGAAEELGESRQQRLGRTLEDLQQLTLGLESLRRRAGQAADGEAGGERSQNDAAGTERQQQGGDSSSQSGGQTAGGGQNAGPVANGGDGGLDVDGRYGGYDGFTGRQIARELDIRQGELRTLTETLRRERLDDRGLAKIRQRLQALEQGVVAGDPRSLEALAREVIERLKELEFGLRRELESDDPGRRLTVSEDGPVPDRYRSMVEEYYRSLSRITPAGG